MGVIVNPSQNVFALTPELQGTYVPTEYLPQNHFTLITSLGQAEQTSRLHPPPRPRPEHRHTPACNMQYAPIGVVEQSLRTLPFQHRT